MAAARGADADQVLDIDVKLRWGLEQSTVASIFIAVFFIVSEGAQEFLGAAASNEWIGIIAAAGLVFFMAPLQRLAERVGARPAGRAASRANARCRSPRSLRTAAPISVA